MAGLLCDRLEAAPVLPARARVDKIIAKDLIERLHDDAAAQALGAHFAEYPRSAALVAGILAHSPFLTQIMRQDPAGLLACLTSAPEAHRDALLAEIERQGGAATESAELMRLLRRFRRAMALLIALADIGGIWNVETVTASMSCARPPISAASGCPILPCPARAPASSCSRSASMAPAS